MRLIFWLLLILTGCSEFQIKDSQDGSIFDLKVVWNNNVETTVSSDLSQNSLVPRIDADDRQTYFWVKNKIYVNKNIWCFQESFQGSGSILGPPRIPPPKYIWDGFDFRLGIGLSWDYWQLEGGPVFYTLSPSHRHSNWGALVGLNWEF